MEESHRINDPGELRDPARAYFDQVMRGQEIHDAISRAADRVDEATEPFASEPAAWQPPEEDTMSMPADGELIPYTGVDREFLDASVAPARRRGLEVDFLQGVHGRGMKRVIRVVDPAMPEKLREQEYRLPSGHSWRDGLVSLGLIRGVPRAASLEVPINVIHEWRFEPLHLPAQVRASMTVTNVGTEEYGVLLTLAYRRTLADDWREAARHAFVVPVGMSRGGFIDLQMAQPGEYKACYQLGGDGDLVSNGGQVQLQTADGFAHTYGEGGSSASTPIAGGPMRSDDFD